MMQRYKNYFLYFALAVVFLNKRLFVIDVFHVFVICKRFGVYANVKYTLLFLCLQQFYRRANKWC